MASAGHHAVGKAGLHHHDAEVQHVVQLLVGGFGGHALRFAQLVELACKLGAQLGRARVHDPRTVESVCGGFDGGRVAKDDEVGHAVGQDALRSRQRTLVVAFREHDGLLVLRGSGEHGIEK